MTFYVYLLRCRDGSYYAGHTDDIDCRQAQHKAGEYDGCTRERRPLRLAYVEDFPDREQAFARERQLKGWSRTKKEALIKGNYLRGSLDPRKDFGELSPCSPLRGRSFDGPRMSGRAPARQSSPSPTSSTSPTSMCSSSS